MSANIPFDTTDKALRMEITRNVIKSIHQQAADIAQQTIAKRQQAAELKTGDPHKEPPSVPPLNRNPIKHDVVAWRHSGGLDSWKFETKESALEAGQALSWVVYYKWALMRGRDLIERHDIAIPADMGLREDGLPYKI